MYLKKIFRKHCSVCSVVKNAKKGVAILWPYCRLTSNYIFGQMTKYLDTFLAKKDAEMAYWLWGEGGGRRPQITGLG
jgi:hypothetical protein